MTHSHESPNAVASIEAVGRIDRHRWWMAGVGMLAGTVAMVAAGLRLADAERLVSRPLAERLSAVADRWHEAQPLAGRRAAVASPVLPEHLWLSRLDLDSRGQGVSVGDTHIVQVAGGGEQQLHVVAMRDVDAAALGLEPPRPGRQLVLISLRAPDDRDGRLIRIITEVARPGPSKPAERTRM